MWHVNNPILHQKDMILKLMEHAADLDCPNVKGVTPVQLFVSNGVLDMTHLLLLNGADVNQTNQGGEINNYFIVIFFTSC